MDKIKKKLISECRYILHKTLENVESAMMEAQRQANEYGAPKDRYDPFRPQMMRKRDMYAQQTHKTLQDISLLEKISPDTKLNEVSLGALVRTSTQNLFVAIGLGKIEINETTYYAISPAVPIFKIIQGLKKGDKYVFQGKTCEILDVI